MKDWVDSFRPTVLIHSTTAILFFDNLTVYQVMFFIREEFPNHSSCILITLIATSHEICHALRIIKMHLCGTD